MVDSREFVVDDVLQHHGDLDVRPGQERGVPRDVLADPPEDAVLVGLGGAGAEELDAAQPDGGDAVVLVAAGGDGELEGDGGPGRSGAEWERGVGGGEGRGVDGVGEGVGDDAVGAGGREDGRGEGLGELHVLVGRAGVGGETGPLVEAVGECGGGGGGEEEEEEGGGGGRLHCSLADVSGRRCLGSGITKGGPFLNFVHEEGDSARTETS